MSFLAPLYVLGALGISLPILFHLIRRQPRGQRRFSSLMFLRPTPPTLTRRSRLSHWPLLLLRALALILLAMAFARPFLRSPLIEPEDLPGKRIVLLLDTSASMRRDGLWQQATQAASNVLQQLKPRDQIAVVAFDSQPRIEVSLEQSAALEFDSRREAALQAIKGIKPSWASSDLGDALILAADLLSTTETDSPRDSTDAPRSSAPPADLGQIIVISDMQSGGEQNLNSLQAYTWPRQVRVEIQNLAVDRTTNAFASVLSPSVEEDPSEAADANARQGKTRVRVTNSGDATTADFTLAWADEAGQAIEATRMPVHVGPGESHVIRMLEPTASVTQAAALKLLLEGDDQDFDNVRYVARPEPVEQQLLYIGTPSADPRESLLYYLQRAPLDRPGQKVSVTNALLSAVPDALDPGKTPLVVIADTPGDAAVQSLKRYVTSGGRLLWVLDASADRSLAQRSLSRLMDAAGLSIDEAPTSDYAMLSSIDFGHPLFHAFADPRYNDFSKIRFWSHRNLGGLPPSVQSLAEFDDGTPAIVQQSLGEGQLWILTSGWQPTNSQLALSTKFVPLLAGLYRYGALNTADMDQVEIGDALPLPPSPTATITRSGQQPIAYREQSDAAAVSRPGIYRYVDGDVTRPFAVNVPEAESRTQPMASDELERYGVVLGERSDGAERLAQQRQQRDVELESRQRIWQWILLAALGLLALESWLSGYLDRKQLATAVG